MAVDIVILGPPGAGKGTQSQRISVAFGLAHVSTGEMFRQQSAEDTELGREVKALLDRGQLAPDDLACRTVKERIRKRDCASGCVFDGFPRSESQAVALDGILGEVGRSVMMAINIEVPDDEVVSRLTARRMCPLCGSIYNERFNPPRRPGLCDNPECEDQALVQRDDDREEVIRERLRVYHRNEEPIIQYYAAQDKLRVVKACSLSADGVFEKIESLLSSTDPALVP